MELSNQGFSVVEAKDLKVSDLLLSVSSEKRIKSISFVGMRNSYDISLYNKNDLFGDEENFVLSNGLVAHNCSLEILKECCNIIREREQVNLNSLNIPISDKIAIKKSSKKDLLGIFQMESPATKPIADEVVLEDLNDIAALTSLIRPGPKNEGLDMLYAKRKHGEPYELHDKLKPILGSTYGVMTYQEQCLKRGSKVNTLYGQYSIERLKALFDIGCFIPVQCRDEVTGADFYHEPEAVLLTGKKSCLKITLDDGCIIEVTPDHKIFTSNRGYVKASELITDDDIVTDKRQFN